MARGHFGAVVDFFLASESVAAAHAAPSGSLYLQLSSRKRLGITIAFSMQARNHRASATDRDRELLDLDDVDYLAVVKSQTFDAQGTMIEYTQSRHRLDHFCFRSTAVRQNAHDEKAGRQIHHRSMTSGMSASDTPRRLECGGLVKCSACEQRLNTGAAEYSSSRHERLREHGREQRRSSLITAPWLKGRKRVSHKVARKDDERRLCQRRPGRRTRSKNVNGATAAEHAGAMLRHESSASDPRRYFAASASLPEKSRTGIDPAGVGSSS